MSEEEKLKDYLESTNAFEKSEKDNLREKAKTAWRITKFFGFLVCLSFGMLYVMLPLKQTITEVLVLDRTTGHTEPLQRLEEVQLSLDDVFHQSNLNTFIMARENYTYDTAEKNYYTTAAFMSPQLQVEWANLWTEENPQNPINLYKSGKVQIDVISISTFQKGSGRMDVATIRFKKTITTGAGIKIAQHWLATISYRFVQAATDPKQRRINPLGFQVTHYQVDPETIGQQPAASVQ